MKYYAQYRTLDLFELQASLSGLSKSNRRVKLADNLPWDKIEKSTTNVFGTAKRVYRANNIRAKLDGTADSWIGTCFFAKNVMKFLRGPLCLIFKKLGLKALKKRFIAIFDNPKGVFSSQLCCMAEIN